ncbi:alkaline phosphatase [Sutcliffiella rhizosphaerae]|uniref:Alkaline phosphatase 4 n=1 Tax=Sutcliffiella rhizosphaerae TaxID=2880967 RepID=A0ABM8YUE6_9BACI|nr:alkaline phosphatase [Sutcliffiella rhizosphaerae]CAG9623583.1 Alkaline phosphatase 4 [Sutcliffiella rhizosphaerae]
MLKKIASVALAAGLLFSGLQVTFGGDFVKANNQETQNQGKVKNVIFMIPDGYNAGYATNYRWYIGEDSSFDPHVKGLIKTHSANTAVTDSAAAGTAMATGHKTNNGMIGVTPDGKEVYSILKAAKRSKKATGLVATSTITHATPAVFAANVASRSDEASIAPQYLENNLVDVILGGGRDYFTSVDDGGRQPEGNLIKEAEKKGYQYVTDKTELSKAKGTKLLGLFAKGSMSPEMQRDETEEPSLEEMTNVAINTLNKNKQGFFLMVEGSQIDWAGHAHDSAWAMTDTAAFDQAVEAALEFAKKDGKTLVVVAGDHETGGMSVGSNGQYDLKIDILHNVTATGDKMASEINSEKSNIREVVKKYTSLELSDSEVEKIINASNTSIAINNVVSDRALVGWTSTAHTGTDLPIYAFGPQSNKFSGLLDNTDIPRIMAEAMKIKFN